ncbi:MAG: CCA tRNA nucleotidyltransferase [Pseudomonadota bacterium]
MSGALVDPAWVTDRRLPADLMAAPGLGPVFAALGGGETAFLVGGAVRNGLLGLRPGDFDVATPLLPEEVQRRLVAAGLKAVPTGIDHGTITAVAQGTGVEVTTLRADLETDGRHATVAFGQSLAADAARRDFTMNALYADATGRVIDPLGGLADLEARRLRFIGAPAERIREDYLRILRFFRFHAWYADPDGGIDAEGLAACAAEAEGIEGLARERIGHEFRRLLAAPDPAPALAAMQAAGILARCLPGATAAPVAPLVHLEALAGRRADWRARLAAIMPAALDAREGLAEVAEALRLAKAERRTLEAIVAARHCLAEGNGAGAAAYHHGADAAWAAVLVDEAHAGWRATPPALAGPDHTLEAAIERGAAARLPLRAADLTAAGLEPGAAIGEALKIAEAGFVKSAFTLDRQALLAHVLHELGQNS